MRPPPAIFLTLFLPELPAILVWLAGLVLAIVTWRRHPQVSGLVICSLVLFLLDVVAGAWSAARLPFLAGGAAGMLVGLAAGLRGLVRALAWILILVAVFGRRRESL
jgi:hypothetical protein